MMSAVFTAKRSRDLPATPDGHPGTSRLSAEIRLSVPAGATQDDVSRILTSVLTAIAEEYGSSVFNAAHGKAA